MATGIADDSASPSTVNATTLLTTISEQMDALIVEMRIANTYLAALGGGTTIADDPAVLRNDATSAATVLDYPNQLS